MSKVDMILEPVDLILVKMLHSTLPYTKERGRVNRTITLLRKQYPEAFWEHCYTLRELRRKDGSSISWYALKNNKMGQFVLAKLAKRCTSIDVMMACHTSIERVLRPEMEEFVDEFCMKPDGTFKRLTKLQVEQIPDVII